MRLTRPSVFADTKRKFIEAYPKPVPAIYNVVIQELLVQQHFVRNSVNYKYNPVRRAAGAGQRGSARGPAHGSPADGATAPSTRPAARRPHPRSRPPQILALGMVSVFDQILDGYNAAEAPKIWAAYIRSLSEDPERFRVRRGGGGVAGGPLALGGAGACSWCTPAGA
jgi:hypothetical protein